MRNKDVALRSLLCMILLFSGLGYAQQGQKGKPIPPPAENVSAKRHPNLAAAQRHLDQAFEKIQAAQQANEWDLAGHARKAKELIDQADRELKQAAETANQEHK